MNRRQSHRAQRGAASITSLIWAVVLGSAAVGYIHSHTDTSSAPEGTSSAAAAATPDNNPHHFPGVGYLCDGYSEFRSALSGSVNQTMTKEDAAGHLQSSAEDLTNAARKAAGQSQEAAISDAATQVARLRVATLSTDVDLISRAGNAAVDDFAKVDNLLRNGCA